VSWIKLTLKIGPNVVVTNIQFCVTRRAHLLPNYYRSMKERMKEACKLSALVFERQ